MNLQSLDLLHFFSRRFHGSCQEGERPARGRVVPRGDFVPMRSNNAERTVRPLWVKSRHLRRKTLFGIAENLQGAPPENFCTLQPSQNF